MRGTKSKDGGRGTGLAIGEEKEWKKFQEEQAENGGKLITAAGWKGERGRVRLIA